MKKYQLACALSGLIWAVWPQPGLATDLKIVSFNKDQTLTVTNAYAQGVASVESSFFVDGFYIPRASVFSTQSVMQIPLEDHGSQTFYRAVAVDLTPGSPNGRPGFTNLIYSYDTIDTIAGAGGVPDAVNKWRPEFEGGPATQALLSRPHIAYGDSQGNIYIADKDAHAIRKVSPNGIITTVAGNNTPGNAPDNPNPATSVSLNEPNGLWITSDDTIYILDLANNKIRRLGTNGMMSTLFQDFGGISAGRGLWVSDDASEVYYSSATVIKKWTPTSGVTIFASGFANLGNIAWHPHNGTLAATDRGGHRVWAVGPDGSKSVMAGNSLTFGGGDGQLATETGLNEVRGICFLPSGAYFVCTHRGSQVWYVDVDGYIHQFLNGDTGDTHAGDGRWFYNPFRFTISEPRAITMDRQGNLLLTEHDAGYIRRIDFRRHVFDD